MAFMSRAQESRCWALACSTERSRVSTPQLRNSQFPINSQNETPKTPKTPKRRKLPKLRNSQEPKRAVACRVHMYEATGLGHVHQTLRSTGKTPRIRLRDRPAGAVSANQGQRRAITF